jgi:hypothetical protein
LFLRRYWRSNKVKRCTQDFLIPLIAQESHSRKDVPSQWAWIHDGVGSFLPRRFMNLTQVHAWRENQQRQHITWVDWVTDFKRYKWGW